MIDVGLSFGPSAKAEGLIQPYKVATWDTIPDSAKDAEGYWYGDYYGVLSFVREHRHRQDVPQDWSDLLKPRICECGGLRRRPAHVEPRRSGSLCRGPGGRRRGRSRGGNEAGLEFFEAAQQGRQFRARRSASPPRSRRGRRRSSSPGTITTSPARRCSTATRRSGDRGAEDRRRRRRLRAGDQRLRAASQRREAVDGAPLFGRRPAPLAEGLLPSRSASTTSPRTARFRRR